MGTNKSRGGQKQQDEAKDDENLTQGKDDYNERLGRIKEVFGVKLDSELADALGITQQAVSYATRNKRIPKPWLKKAAKKGATEDYVLHGMGKFEPRDELGLYPTEIEDPSPVLSKRQVGQRKKGFAPVGFNHMNKEFNLARGIVGLFKERKGIQLDKVKESYLTLTVVGNILPEIMTRIEEMMTLAEGMIKTEDSDK